MEPEFNFVCRDLNANDFWARFPDGKKFYLKATIDFHGLEIYWEVYHSQGGAFICADPSARCAVKMALVLTNVASSPTA